MLVMPAKAGIHGATGTALRVAEPLEPTMDLRFRGGDDGNAGSEAKFSSLEPFTRLS